VLRDNFNAAMKSLVDEFGESMPHQTSYAPGSRGRKKSKVMRPLIFLHCGIFPSKQAVFRDMKKNGMVPPRTLYSSLRKLWHAHWWNVKIKTWQPFAKCDDCVKYRARLLTTTFQPAVDELRQSQAVHRNQISIGRRRYDIREKLSEQYPKLFLHASADAMDNKKTNLPQSRHFSHTKKTAGGELLKTRIMGEYKYSACRTCPPEHNREHTQYLKLEMIT